MLTTERSPQIHSSILWSTLHSTRRNLKSSCFARLSPVCGLHVGWSVWLTFQGDEIFCVYLLMAVGSRSIIRERKRERESERERERERQIEREREWEREIKSKRERQREPERERVRKRDKEQEREWERDRQRESIIAVTFQMNDSDEVCFGRCSCRSWRAVVVVVCLCVCVCVYIENNEQ